MILHQTAITLAECLLGPTKAVTEGPWNWSPSNDCLSCLMRMAWLQSWIGCSRCETSCLCLTALYHMLSIFRALVLPNHLEDPLPWISCFPWLAAQHQHPSKCEVVVIGGMCHFFHSQEQALQAQHCSEATILPRSQCVSPTSNQDNCPSDHDRFADGSSNGVPRSCQRSARQHTAVQCWAQCIPVGCRAVQKPEHAAAAAAASQHLQRIIP